LTKRVLLITGAPGTGKTTVLSKVVDLLKAKGLCVGGMISHEAREGGVRVGFEIVNLTNGKRGWLAHVDQMTGPQMGKYRVNLADLDGVGAKAIAEATEKCAIIVIDEVGPMELFSDKFKQAVAKALESDKVVLAVIHAKAKDPLIAQVKQRKDAEAFTVTIANREGLADLLTEATLSVS